jgi:hypothetical protein
MRLFVRHIFGFVGFVDSSWRKMKIARLLCADPVGY